MDVIGGACQLDWTATTGLQPSGLVCRSTIGRSDELAALHAFLARPGGLLLISGEAGIGKSRLVREARSLADHRGIHVVEGRCFEADRALPFAPALHILRALVDRHGAAEVADLAKSATIELARLLPELAPGTAAAGRDGVDGETAKRRLLDGFAHLLTSIADERPLLLVIEDIHWTEASSLDLLLHLAPAPRRT